MVIFTPTVDFLKGRKTIAPIYYIIAGIKPGDGVVLSMNREKAEDVWKMKNDNDSWYLAQTNYDHWISPAPWDDNNRRATANKGMESYGREFINLENMNSVLLTPPVLNNFTLYTSLMYPKGGTFVNYFRNYSG